jgi:hypothetical protein
VATDAPIVPLMTLVCGAPVRCFAMAILPSE